MEILLLAIAGVLCFLIYKKLTEPVKPDEEITLELPMKFHSVTKLPDHGIPGHMYVIQSENNIYVYDGEDYHLIGNLQKGV